LLSLISVEGARSTDDADPIRERENRLCSTTVTANRHDFDADLRIRISDNLDTFEWRTQPDPELRSAAVALIVTANENGEACFLITRRTSKLRHHSGQFALPGGRLDDQETIIEAALRETHEEIGLQLTSANVLGRLDDFATRSGFRMSPIVVWAEPGQSLRPNPDEVEELHIVPLSELEKPGSPILRDIPESDRPVLSIPILNTLVHTPTAAILFQFREVALAGRHTRVAHYEQPVFAWR
jgi:8-oxo-dGTP pyrophosphatase MutT (NUDIX family)